VHQHPPYEPIIPYNNAKSGMTHLNRKRMLEEARTARAPHRSTPGQDSATGAVTNARCNCPGVLASKLSYRLEARNKDDQREGGDGGLIVVEDHDTSLVEFAPGTRRVLEESEPDDDEDENHNKNNNNNNNNSDEGPSAKSNTKKTNVYLSVVRGIS
jgi:hypothetical protein